MATVVLVIRCVPHDDDHGDEDEGSHRQRNQSLSITAKGVNGPLCYRKLRGPVSCQVAIE
eukprot:43472-Eustigmatos_ZCMA.PRE.1